MDKQCIILSIGEIIYLVSLCPPDVEAFRGDRRAADGYSGQTGNDGSHHWPDDNHHIAMLQVLVADSAWVANDKHVALSTRINRPVDRFYLNG